MSWKLLWAGLRAGLSCSSKAVMAWFVHLKWQRAGANRSPVSVTLPVLLRWGYLVHSERVSCVRQVYFLSACMTAQPPQNFKKQTQTLKCRLCRRRFFFFFRFFSPRLCLFDILVTHCHWLTVAETSMAMQWYNARLRLTAFLLHLSPVSLVDSLIFHKKRKRKKQCLKWQLCRFLHIKIHV